MIKKISDLFEQPGFRKYFANTGWLYFGRVFQMAIALFVSVWVARYLGPDKYGLLNYAQSFVGLFIGVSTLGLDSIVIRELNKDETKRDELLGTAFILKIVGAFITILALSIAMFFIQSDFYTNLLIFIVASSVIFQSLNVIDFYFQSKVASKYVVFSNIISLTITSVIKVVLILVHAPLIYFVIVVALDSVILSAGFIYFYKKHDLKFSSWEFNRSLSLSLLKDSWPLMLSYMSYLLYVRIDQVMIKNMLDNKSVGLYSAAFRIYEIAIFLPVVLSQSIYPLMINNFINNRTKFYWIYTRITSLLTLISYVIVIGFFILSTFIVNVLYGEEYRLAAPLLPYLALGLIPMFNAGLRSNFMTITNNQKIILYTSMFSAVLNIVLNFFLIPHLGIVGSVYATVITQIVSLVLLNYIFKSTRELFYIQIRALALYGLFGKIKNFK